MAPVYKCVLCTYNNYLLLKWSVPVQACALESTCEVLYLDRMLSQNCLISTCMVYLFSV